MRLHPTRTPILSAAETIPGWMLRQTPQRTGPMRAGPCIIDASFPITPEGRMPRRRKPAGLECLHELARKAAILEQELAAQREAIDRLAERAARRADAPVRPVIRPAIVPSTG